MIHTIILTVLAYAAIRATLKHLTRGAHASGYRSIPVPSPAQRAADAHAASWHAEQERLDAIDARGAR